MIDLHFIFPSCLSENDRSTVSLSNLFIAAPQIYSLSFAPVYYRTTDLHFLLPSCLLQHDLHVLFCSCLLRLHRSTLCLLRRGLLEHDGSAHFLSVLFVTTNLHFLFPSVYYNAKELHFLFPSVYYNAKELSFLFPSCLLQRERAAVFPSVLFY